MRQDVDRSHLTAVAALRLVLSSPRRETQSRGRSGSRWELQQAPLESGSRYGQSVFLDVYQAESKPPGTATICL